MPARAPDFLIVLALATVNLWAASVPSQEAHLASDPGSALYRQSSFAHGYTHGYEDGFHNGNLDYEMGHNLRDIREFPEYRDSGKRDAQGDRNAFRTGYIYGLRVGYSDGFAGRGFRALILARNLAGGAGNQDVTTPRPPS